MRQLTWMDKSSWGEGAFQQEPDKAYWVDPATGLDCLIVRNDSGALCGYVGVPESHPYFGLSENWSTIRELKVHGGITFTSFCSEDKEHGVCHVPDSGRPEHVWWIGFDTAHAGDLCPGWSWLRVMPSWNTYKNFDYVKAEVESLSQQLILAT